MNIKESFDNITRYSGKWSQYYDIYEFWFNKFQNKSPQVLEIGIWCGGSMEAWKNYFGPNSVITGIDNNPKTLSLDIPDTFIEVGDQGNSEYWDKFIEIHKPFDVVIDDGSHQQQHQILTFEKLFPTMNDGGIYMVEDTHSSYMSHFGGAYKKHGTFIEYCKHLVDMLHVDHFDDPVNEPAIARKIKSMHFYDSVVVFEKGFREKSYPTAHNKHLEY